MKSLFLRAMFSSILGGIISVVCGNASNFCCAVDATDSSSEDSVSSIASVLFGERGPLPQVAPLHPHHKDSMDILVEGVFLERRETFKVTNGSLIGFSVNGLIGKVIKTCSLAEKSGFSHVGMAIIGKPSEMLEIVKSSINEGGLSQRKRKYKQAQIEVFTTRYPYLKKLLKNKERSPKLIELLENEETDVFCYESNGSANEVLRGLAPRVTLTPLSVVAAQYAGDVCIRPLLEPIPLENLQPVLAKELGVTYETKMLQLIGSTKNRNTIEDSSAWFCSELVAYIYKTFDLLNNDFILSNNVTPDQFRSNAPDDLLKGKAGNECYVRRYNEEIACFKKIKLMQKNKMRDFKNGKTSLFKSVATRSSPLVPYESQTPLTLSEFCKETEHCATSYDSSLPWVIMADQNSDSSTEADSSSAETSGAD